MTGTFLVDDRLKGVPLGTEPFPIEEIGRRGWNLLRDGARLPAAVLKQSALERNAAWMRRFIEASDALFAPHGKTTMSPELFRMQLENGAWAITLAHMGQVRAARRHGIPRVFLANVVVDRSEIAWALAELRRDPGFEMLFLVDSVDAVERLRDEAVRQPPPRPLPLLVERGYPGGRTGCRTTEEALLVARRVAQSQPQLALGGVSGFEGLLGSDLAAEARVVEFLDAIRETAEACDRERLLAPGRTLLSAGGSAYYDLVAERFAAARLAGGVQILIRSGCYLTQDGGPYATAFARILARSERARALGGGLEPALEVWGQVLSRPEPTRAVVNLGKRDVAHDLGLPRVVRVARHGRAEPVEGITTAGLNDQHALLDVPAGLPLFPGDRLGFWVSHPCLTFDRWPMLLVVDDAYDVVSAVHTLF
jgi:D-serine dehydratase